MFLDYIHLRAAEDAQDSKLGLEARATVSNMLAMCNENKKFIDVKQNCYELYGKNTDVKKKKLEYASMILERVETDTEGILEEFCQKYRIKNFAFDEDKQKILYLDGFLKQLKYIFRQAENEKGGSEDGQRNE